MSDRDLPGIQPDKPAGGKSSNRGCLFLFLVPILIIVAIYTFTPKDSSRTDGYLAESACEDAVRNQLRSPSTAKFDSSHSGSGSSFSVTGSVDAENGFGATVRAYYSCSVTVSGGEAVARLTSFD